ncbi:hypothetical protein Tco_1487813, partial [Tanacetum coccineum]
DIEENSDDDADERTSEEYLKDLDIEFHERALLTNSKSKLALLEASPLTSQSLKPIQPKNKSLVAETFNWDEEKVSDDEEETQVKVLKI